MSLRDGFKQLVVETFMGLLTTQRAQDCPANYAPVCRNAVFTTGAVGMRPGTSTFLDLGGGTDIFHAEAFIFGDTRYQLYLMQDHKLYYTTEAGGPRTLLASPSGGPTHFQAVVYGNLVYLFFGGALGTFGCDEVRVWSPTGGWVDRITILPEAIGAMAAADGAAGSVTAGVHKIKVVFETRSGYRSKPTDGVVTVTAAGSKVLDVTDIPLYIGSATHAAAECTKRHLVMTEADLDTYYLVATINDNTTTTATIDTADEQLRDQTDVTDYFQFTSPMPSLSAGKIYADRLVVCGNSGASSIAYISQRPDNGGPQAFRGDVGFLDINHDDGVSLVQIFKIRDVIYFIKGLGIFATQDNGAEPDTWPLRIISHNIGTASVSGVSEASDEDFVVIQDFRGMYYFNGSPPEKISKNIQPTWDTLSIPYLKTAEIRIDTKKRRIYNLVPTGSAQLPDKVLVLDYQAGWDKARWSDWTTAGAAIRSIMIDTGGYRVLLACASALVRKLDDAAITDNGSAIDFEVRQGLMEPGNVGVNLFGGLTLHTTGSGTMALKIYGPDMTLLYTDPLGFVLATAPEEDQFARLNLRTERIFVGMSHNAVDASSATSRMTVYMKPDGTRAF